ncbi:UMTA methyltransferase family protein, partial [Glonium stellatum]
QSYTTSLNSSVLHYQYEHGRRYHAYREGVYSFPNDEREQDRLDMLSHIVRLACNSKLHQKEFPKDKPPRRILDVGTGTGLWAIEAGEVYPNAEVIGNDLSPIQPGWVPPNVVFEVDDVESDWPDRPPFDFIHVRYMCASIKDWPALVRRCYENTAPGGWVEFQDWARIYSQDNVASSDSSIVKMYDLLTEACDEKLGRMLWPGPKLKGWIEDAKFVNVTHKVVKIPLGTWPKAKTLKQIGALNLVQFLEGCEAYILAPFTRYLGWSAEECQLLLAKVRKEAKDKSLHFVSD